MDETLHLNRLPDAPYKGLDYYTVGDGPLFAGRGVDTEKCAEVVAATSTRILILHGRSGVGKSSFLRAALIPRLQRLRPGFHLLCRSGATGPVFIRATGNPVRRVHEELLSASRSDLELREIWNNHSVAPKPEETEAEACLRITAVFAGKLPSRLMFVIEQAEEVLTEGSRENRAAFMYLLQRLHRYDVKVVLSIRTEYYGQFAELMRITPHFAEAPVGGIAQYMMLGFEVSQIAEAILRPTLVGPAEDVLGAWDSRSPDRSRSL